MTKPPSPTPPTTPQAAPPAKPAVTSLPRDLSDFLVELSTTLNKHTIYPAGHPLLVESGIQISPMPATGDTR